MNRTRIAWIQAILIVGSVFSAGMALAEEEEKWRFSVMPRFWLSQERIGSVEESNFNLGGISLTVAPPESAFDFVVTGFFGPDEEAKEAAGGTGFDIKSRDRLDIETVVRWFPEETPVYFFVGPRFTRIATDARAFDVEEWIGLLELGAGTWAQITERNRLIAGGMFGAGYRYVSEPGTNDRGLSLAFDLHSGWQFTINEYWSVMARYRVFVTPLRQNDSEFAFAVAHGPEVGVGFSF